jgi:hypothetical protein
MGIYANMTTERKTETVYQTIDEAVLEYSQRLNCSTKVQKEILKTYFEQQLQPCDKGVILGGASCSAHIWWKTTAHENMYPETG